MINVVASSISIVGVAVCLLETDLAALEHLLTQTQTVLGLTGVVLQTLHVSVVLRRAFLLDDTHAGSRLVLPWEPDSNHTYSIPLLSSRVLLFFAVENMYDLVSIPSNKN